MPQAHTVFLAHERSNAPDSTMERQLRKTIAAMHTALEQLETFHQHLVEDSLRQEERGEQHLLGLCFVFLQVGVCSLLGGHWLLYRIIIDPLQRLKAAMQHVAQGSFTERVVMQDIGEFSELVASFNAIAAQLEADASIRRVFYQELETQVAERTKALQAANQELQHMLEVGRLVTTSEMAVSVTHEIRQPLNALSINFQMIKRGLREVLPTLDTKLAEHIQLLENEIQRINELSTSFMPLVQVARSQSQPMDLAATIRHVVRLLEYEATAVQVTLHYQSDMVPATDRG